MRKLRSRDRKQSGPAATRGNAILEFALAFSLVWTALAGVFQFGYAMYLYNQLANAAANGARFASRVDFDSVSQTFVTQTQNMVAYGSPTGGVTPMVVGLDPTKVSVTWSTDASGIPQTITVAIVNYTCDAIFRTFTWNNKPAATVRFSGVYKQ